MRSTAVAPSLSYKDNVHAAPMVAEENLWIGTANPMNLLVGTEPIDTLSLEGGWEVIQLGDNEFAFPIPTVFVPLMCLCYTLCRQ